MKCFVRRLRDHDIRDLLVLVVGNPGGHLLAQLIPVRHHGRREDLYSVELDVLSESDLPALAGLITHLRKLARDERIRRLLHSSSSSARSSACAIRSASCGDIPVGVNAFSAVSTRATMRACSTDMPDGSFVIHSSSSSVRRFLFGACAPRPPRL